MSRRLGTPEITLMVVDAMLVVVLIVLLATMPKAPDEAPPVEATPSTSSAAGQPTQTEEPSSTQAVTAPEGALDLAEFSAPSLNIWCTLTDTTATCQIASITYQPPAISGCEGNELAGHVLTVSAEGAKYPCPQGDIAGAAPADRTVLKYGEIAHVGDVMCASSESGVTCTNLSTGANFSVARAAASVSP